MQENKYRMELRVCVIQLLATSQYKQISSNNIIMYSADVSNDLNRLRNLAVNVNVNFSSVINIVFKFSKSSLSVN